MESITIAQDTTHVHDCLPFSSVSYRIEPNVTFTLIEEQNVSSNSEYVRQIHFFLDASSKLIYIPLLMGASKIELNIVLYLQQESSAIIAGAYALNSKQQCSIATRQEHQGANSKSNITFNGIAAHDSSVSYQGMIAIGKDAAKSVAYQQNKTILLGNRSRAFSIPSIEVHTNDVQCGHGAAVGPLDAHQLVYAQSRGMPFIQAQQLLLESFYAQTLACLSDSMHKESLIKKMVGKVIKDAHD